MALNIVAFFALCCLASRPIWAMERSLLSKRPIGDPNAYISKSPGRLYLYAFYNPCSWNGAKDFTDWTMDFSTDPNTGIISVVDTWRSRAGDFCTSATVKMTSVTNSRFVLKDPIGNLLSGEVVLVATDNKSFSVYWGCTKMSADGSKCGDFWASVGTKHRDPSPYTIRIVEKILMKQWNLPLSELRKIPHNNPC